MGVSALVMAKAPRPGSVKTRLEPLLGPEGCVALQAELIAVASRWAAAVAPGRAYVACGPDAAGPAEVGRHASPGVELFADGEGDLGDRLATATTRVLAVHPEPLLVVGTDMPLLRAEDAVAAEEALRAGAGAVFGPALDGGYWLVGLNRPAPALFELGEDWGGPRVLARSLAAAAELGLGTELLAARRDLDDPDDAAALLAEHDLPESVAELLRGTRA